MIASETSIWRWMRDDKERRAESRTQLDMNRVENSAGSGMPDVEGIYIRSQFWLELKAADRPKTADGKVDVKHLRPKQVEWLHNRWLAGGNAWILIRVKRAYYLIPGKHSREVKAGMTETRMASLSALRSNTPSVMEIIRTASMST